MCHATESGWPPVCVRTIANKKPQERRSGPAGGVRCLFHLPRMRCSLDFLDLSPCPGRASPPSPPLPTRMLSSACRKDGTECRRIVGVGDDVVNRWKGAAHAGVLLRHIDESRAQTERYGQHAKTARAELRPPLRKRQHGQDNGDRPREEPSGWNSNRPAPQPQIIILDLRRPIVRKSPFNARIAPFGEVLARRHLDSSLARWLVGARRVSKPVPYVSLTTSTIH
jgi:hypothetical protein